MRISQLSREALELIALQALMSLYGDESDPWDVMVDPDHEFPSGADVCEDLSEVLGTCGLIPEKRCQLEDCR